MSTPSVVPTFSNILDSFDELTRSGFLSAVERIDLPARLEVRRPIPAAFAETAVGDWLRSHRGTEHGLWKHQSLALERLAGGENVVIATGTASGKSLVFQATALRLILEDPHARVAVFYPLKALANDQLVSWREAVRFAGLPPDTVAELTGQTLTVDRPGVIAKARILLMTPDVCHAWMMSNVATPAVRQFLGGLRLLVLDEAHVLESVFGSNVAFLLRRIQAARMLALGRAAAKSAQLQVVAASATILAPEAHLERLTGLSFSVVGEEEDGSPRHARSLLHVAVGRDGRAALQDILARLLDQSSSGSFIAFDDSRQGVEKVARKLAHDGVRPYRSGYESDDRMAIETALRNGALRGVVSTSALELGINIPHFVLGLNNGVPNSRKAFRQRVGRVGRDSDGVFVILADPKAFRRLGGTFVEYWEGSVEASHLYLENRFMQFTHAKCLADELEALGGDRSKLPGQVAWPRGFAEVFEFARPGGARPREFDTVAQIGGDSPHYNFPLRNVGEPSFRLGQGGEGPRYGDLTLQQAIREADPGAVPLHLTCSLQVCEWRNTNFERLIRVYSTQKKPITRPFIRTYVNADISPEGIVEGHYLAGDGGVMAECNLQINERVEGFYEGKNLKLYKELRQNDPSMSAKARDFRTTGVLLLLRQPWIKDEGAKKQLGSALKELVLREYSIAPRDIDVAWTNISLLRGGTRESATDAIVLYDSTHGSLRLTEPMFRDFADVLLRLEQAAIALTPDEEPLISPVLAANLREWFTGMKASEPAAASPTAMPAGWIRVLKPGSRAGLRSSSGYLSDIEIVRPLLHDPAEFGADGPAGLFYEYRAWGGPGNNGTQKRNESMIETVGDEWSWVLWNTETGEFADEQEE